MTPTDTDAAKRRPFDPQLSNSHLQLLRDSVQSRDAQNANGPRLNSGFGSIQIVRPLLETAGEPTIAPNADDGLSAARGMIMGVALGAGFWLAVAGMIRFFLF